MFKRLASTDSSAQAANDSRKGNTTGGVLLIAGSCIGVGMLSLPVLTSFSGFLPAFCIFSISWIFMTVTALLFLEANLWFSSDNNLFSLADKTLGKPLKLFAGVNFIFLFYCLMVAYVCKGGDLVQLAFDKSSLIIWPKLSGRILITISSFILVYFGTWIVDRFNRVIMFSLFITYIYLLLTGIDLADVKLLQRSDWSYSLFIIPFLITSFGFHNMIPTIRDYLDSDQKKIKATIYLGGLIVFFVYLLWIVKIHSTIPFEGEISLRSSFNKGEISSESLAAILNSPNITLFVNFFSFFAIITSFLGQGLSLIDFFSDSFKIPKTPNGRLWLCSVSFFPPLIFSCLFPHIFFTAIELAGGTSAIILFGVLPTCIVWAGRNKFPQTNRLVKGGKCTLVLVLLFSFLVLIYEIVKIFNKLIN